MKEMMSVIGFPITLITSTFLVGLIGIFYKRELFKEIIFWNLLLGVMYSIGALYILIDMKEQVNDQRIIEIMEVREKTAYFLVLFLCGLFGWMAWRKKEMDRMEYSAWLALFFVACPSIAYIGYIGNEMTNQKTQKMIEVQVGKAKAIQQNAAYDLY